MGEGGQERRHQAAVRQVGFAQADAGLVPVIISGFIPIFFRARASAQSRFPASAGSDSPYHLESAWPFGGHTSITSER